MVFINLQGAQIRFSRTPPTGSADEPEIEENHGRNRIDSICTCLFGLIEALNCKNVSTVNAQNASTKNEKRIKAGKIPFYETKMLVINAHSVLSNKTDDISGTRASPRQHLRRGHIRRLASGNIWINSFLAGDATKGTITKSYTVK